MARHRVLDTAVDWGDARSRVFPYAACIDGVWLVLRLNDFPDHPLYTLFADGRCIGDLDDPPKTWRLGGVRPPLRPDHRVAVLKLMRGLGPYGAEVGRPCDGDWCNCTRLTDEYAAEHAQHPYQI